MSLIFIEGDFPTGKKCKYHCSPTCHPGQIDENHWHFGCLHKAWPQNTNDFCPFVECGGDPSKCEIPSNFLKNMIEDKESEMNKWISVKERLPIIPKGKYGVQVLIAEYDSLYAELCNDLKKGWNVKEVTFGKCDGLPMYKLSNLKEDFLERWDNGVNSQLGPVSNPVLYWMPLPEPPEFDK